MLVANSELSFLFEGRIYLGINISPPKHQMCRAQFTHFFLKIRAAFSCFLVRLSLSQASQGFSKASRLCVLCS